DWQALPAARVSELAWGLRQYQPQIVHYAGHGSEGGDLFFDPEEGDRVSAALSPQQFADTLRAYQSEAMRPVRLVVLAGCHTARTAELVAQVAGCAVGFQGEPSDIALAKHFTPNLYAALADPARSVGGAVKIARQELRNHGSEKIAEMVRLFPPNSEVCASPFLATPAPVYSQAHKTYLHRLFSQQWATVKMKLFDDKSPEAMDLLDIYSPLPVDFGITVGTNQEGDLEDWWCGSVGSDRGMREDYEPWQQALLDSARHATAAQELREQKARIRSWTDLRSNERALAPLVEIAREWARGQQSNRRRQDEVRRWQANAEHAALVQRRFVLAGDPGSGKSTFLRHLALAWAARMLRAMGETRTDTGASLDVDTGWYGPDYTPVYIELRPLVDAFPALPSGEEPPELPGLDTFEVHLSDQLTAMRCQGFIDDLITLLRNGKAAILLDGLDEVSDADDHRRRMQVQAFVAALHKAFAAAPIIVTARPYAYRPDNPQDPERWELEGFGHTALAALDTERQERLARRLFACLRPDDSRRVEDFLAALPTVPKDLPGNPLLLTLLAAVSVRRPEGEAHGLPKTRGQLYDRALKLLLEDWVKEHNRRFETMDDVGIDSQELRLALQLVARRAQERSTQPNQAVVIQRGDFYDALDDIGKGAATPKVVSHLQWTAGMLLDQVEQTPGAMMAPAPGRFRFLHLSFQEYLAACDMLYRPGTPHARARRVWDDRKFPDELAAQVRQKPRLWANVLRLAVDELLTNGRATDAWELAALCCLPYKETGQDALGALLALQVTLEAGLFAVQRPWGAQQSYETLLGAAGRALRDHTAAEHVGLSPEQRDIAGKLLGSDPFPGHDKRPGVALRPDGLPDIAWIEVLKLDAKGKGDWTYQDERRKPLDNFWIAKYPVTYVQFEAFLRAKDGFGDQRWWDGLAASQEHRANWGDQRFEYWNHPRERVSWYDAMAFCRWLTEEARAQADLLPPGLDRRREWKITLPTEEQWEKAARGHDGRRYPWGSKYEEGRANINETWSGYEVGPHYLQKTSAVGMYPHESPDDSPYGVADLSGNVWEWCLNEYRNPERVQLQGNEWRVLRGGSWNNFLRLASASARGINDPDARLNYLGFRVVLVGFVPVS
ncbi:MAG: SUMF1/EgtB/PvdO family nonheme iron enzyme, partial [Anaerolineae bacterium]|nr:SUMF1/EgtB/PvdO family nonheme iron enzyme [Anaerolineae bacterium]